MNLNKVHKFQLPWTKKLPWAGASDPDKPDDPDKLDELDTETHFLRGRARPAGKPPRRRGVAPPRRQRRAIGARSRRFDSAIPILEHKGYAVGKDFFVLSFAPSRLRVSRLHFFTRRREDREGAKEGPSGMRSVAAQLVSDHPLALLSSAYPS